MAAEKDGRSSAMSEGEGLDEEDDDDEEEGGAETEEQSGNESEMNEQEEDVSSCAPQMFAALPVTLDSETLYSSPEI